LAATTQSLNYDALLTTTLSAYRKKLEDNIFKANPLFYWLDKGGRKKKQDGGFQILVPLMYGKNSTAKSYGKYDTLDTTPQDGMTNAIYPWKHESVSISISRPEERQNSGAARILSLLEGKISQAENSLIEEVNRQLFLDGTGNGGLDVYGLALLIEEGSAWGTLAGIDSNVETWWRNIWTNSGSFATQGINDMRTTYNSASKGNQHPDLILTTQAAFEFYEKVLAANERFTDTTSGDAGFQNLKFKASVMMYDAYCTSGYMYFVNSEFMDWWVDTETDFVNTPFVRPSNQDAKVSQILLYCQLALSNRARQGVMTAIVA
jgi:hypothetical protein